MRLRGKFIIPLFVLVIILGIVGGWLIKAKLENFQTQLLRNIAEEKSHEVTTAINTLASQGLEKAALFSQRSDIIKAYELAHMGNIDDETDAYVQQARNQLRTILADDLKGFHNAAGKAMQLHFHLPKARSLVRLWRDKQTRRDGQWVDISDDLSSFRQTVVLVNTQKQAIQGIEVGSAGFAIRGIVPVVDAHNNQLGSVETLESFESVIQGAASGPGQTMIVYMNKDNLSVATDLQNPDKNPLLGDKFVLVTPTEDQRVEKMITADFLTQGQTQTTYARFGEVAVAAFPIHDYAQRQVGVLVYAFDSSFWGTAIKEIGLYIFVLVGLILVMVSIISSLIMTRLITTPLSKMKKRIIDITEDRADLTDCLDVATKDEIGELCLWFNKLMEKIRLMLADVAQNSTQVSQASENLLDLSQSLTDYSKSMSDKSGTVASSTENMSTNMHSVSSAMEQLTMNIETVASSSEEMSATIAEIAANAARAKDITMQAVAAAQTASTQVGALDSATQKINQVTEVITSISSQTNLLALNATIEAARAGEAGRGFAVVANEIKELAQQTATETEEIRTRILGIEEASNHTIHEIERISSIVNDVDNIVGGIAAAVEEQAVTTRDITENVAQAATSVQHVSQNVAESDTSLRDVAQEVDQVHVIAGDVAVSAHAIHERAEGLSGLSENLDTMVNKFKI